jgi:hypothetical protein
MATLVSPKTRHPEQSVVDYIQYFERCMVANGWTDSVAGKVFPAMFDPEDRSLDSIPKDEMNGGFQCIKETLMKNQKPMREANLVQLMKIKLNEEENIRTFRSRVQCLVSMVYQSPLFPADQQNQLARDHFVHGLPEELREKVLLNGGISLDEAVNIAEALQTIKPPERSVFSMNHGSQNKDANRGQVAHRGPCYRCGREGHIAKFCQQAMRVAGARRHVRDAGNGERLFVENGGTHQPQL